MTLTRAITILKELTNLPTAAGREEAVLMWIEQWAKSLKGVKLKSDVHGNVTVWRPAKRKTVSNTNPLYITAHLDHPAFVVTEIISSKRIKAEFRGGVHRDYFRNTAVKVIAGDGQRHIGIITSLARKPQNPWSRMDVTITLDQPATTIEPNDIAIWNLPATTVRSDRVKAPICDALAAAAAALAMFEDLVKQDDPALAHTRLFFTRAEEVGFVGALGACRSRSIPKRASIIALENSKASAGAPIGNGPIIRVGDRTSIFDNALTYRLTQVAEQLVKQTKRRRSPFQYQRKLMSGGTCEATAFCDAGYTATCICLPLGNYHNMNETTGRIDCETISRGDYLQLIQLLTVIAQQHHPPASSNTPETSEVPKTLPTLTQTLDKLWADRKGILKG